MAQAPSCSRQCHAACCLTWRTVLISCSQVPSTNAPGASGVRYFEQPALGSQLQPELYLDSPAEPQSLLNALPSASLPPDQQMPCLAGLPMYRHRAQTGPLPASC